MQGNMCVQGENGLSQQPVCSQSQFARTYMDYIPFEWVWQYTILLNFSVRAE